MLSFREYKLKRFANGTYNDVGIYEDSYDEFKIHLSIQPINYYVRGMRERILEEGINAREVLKIFSRQELRYWKGSNDTDNMFKPDEILIDGSWYMISSLFDYGPILGGQVYSFTNYLSQTLNGVTKQALFDRLDIYKYLAIKREIREDEA